MNEQYLEILYRFKADIPVVSVSGPLPEVPRIVRNINDMVAIELSLPFYQWDTARGFKDLPESWNEQSDRQTDILEVLRHLESNKPKGIFVLLNPPFTGDDASVMTQAIQNLFFSLRGSRTYIVLLAHEVLPEGVTEIIFNLEIPLPAQSGVREIISSWLKEHNILLSEEDLMSLTRSAQGLSQQEIEDILAESKSKFGVVEARETAASLSNFKVKKLERHNLTFAEKPEVPIGGLAYLKDWLSMTTKLLTFEALESGLSTPKGMLLIGPPGSGKSLVPKVISQKWSVPCLVLDISTIYGKTNASAELNLKNILKMAESLAPCILMIDEIEKILATGDEISLRVFGTFLTWMQEKSALVFVVATVNRVLRIPPELTRPGRFDVTFFVDLPGEEDRVEVLDIHLKKRNVQFEQHELEKLAKKTPDYSGAELEQIVKEAVATAYSEGYLGDLKLEHLLDVAERTIPVSKARKEEIEKIRLYGEIYARPAAPKSYS